MYNMRKAQRIIESCDYKSLIDESMLRRARRHIPNRNIHQIIFTPVPMVYESPLTHASNGFIIGIPNYSNAGDHAIGALLIQGRLYFFNPHGNVSRYSMRPVADFLRTNGFDVQSYVEYSGPNIQAMNTRGVCVPLVSRFLSLHPNASMNQQNYDEYIIKSFSNFSIQNLYNTINTRKSIRNIGIEQIVNVNRNVKRKVRQVVPMNIV